MKTIFITQRKESFNSRLFRSVINFFPSYKNTGGKIVFLSGDWHEIHVQLKLKLSTLNYVGTVFGGSIYSSTDPIYMIELIKILGKQYVVWDKAAQINFLKPIRKKVFAKFEIPEATIAHIKQKVAEEGKYVFDMKTIFEDKEGTVYSEIVKTLYVADKEFYKSRH